MIHWDHKIHNVPRVVLLINHYHIWPILTHFSISLYWFLSVDCYFATICHHQHWVPGCTTSFLSGSHAYWVTTNECAYPLYHVEVDISNLANTEQPLMRCITVSLYLPDKLHISSTSWLLIWCFIEFIRCACSCAARTIASVSFL